LFIGDSRSKYYWINREVFVLEKGVLWREGDEGKSARRVVSKMYREDSLDTFPSKFVFRFPVETQISATLGPILSSSWS
jgi:hypothetical protein